MFRFFPTNYVWDFSINLALGMDAKIGEVQAMCGPLKESAEPPDTSASLAFRNTWVDKLCDLVQEVESLKRMFSAGDKYNRAAIYYLTAERLQGVHSENRTELYKQFLATFSKGIELTNKSCEKVTIPFQDSFLTALFLTAENVDGPMPVLVQLNGLDSTKEMKYRVGLPK
ncbi:MAG: hypothetical protein HWE24_02790 [Oceanospirillaceae bacterium]|nr:hypothetical protein [Oceanospirillaceae bacterium]